jgi:hypothetical protein
MGFNLSDWLLRKKIGAQIRSAGQPVQHHRVGNPFHAVSIEPGMKSCAQARAVDERRFLAGSAPKLPLSGCTMSTCQCHYVHYKDRRNNRDRRVQPHNPHAHKMSERRTAGRRMDD